MNEGLAVAIFSEILAIDQKLRSKLSHALPKGMELSHFSCLNHLASFQGERTPAQIAKALNVTRGAMTNTLSRLEASGYIHIRPDWDDARRKWISISKAGRQQRDLAFNAIAPIFREGTGDFDEETLKQLLVSLRNLRLFFGSS